MMPPSKPLETLSRVTVLGVRFWDSVSRAMISDGLRVSAHPPDDPGRTVRAVTNRVDTFVFYNLAGQREAEQGAGDRAYWESLPPPRPFVVEVEDTAGRFLSFSFNAAVPAEGVFQWQCPPDSSPPESSGAVPLFSGPARAAPGGFAMIRLELQELSRRPAAYAVIAAYHDQALIGRALADEKGRALLIFAYPELAPPSLPSPLGSSSRPLVQQTWPIELKALYHPPAVVPPIPELCAALDQAPARLWRSLSPPFELTGVDLTFGQALVVQSDGESIVWISPA